MPEPAAAEGETDNRYEGTIFGGIKFWLSFKVPSRSTFADKLKVCDGFLLGSGRALSS